MSVSTLAGRVAIVTGASRGIGAAIARRLAADGARVVVNYSASPEAAEQVVAAIRDAGGEAIAVQADVSDSTQVARLFAEAKTAYGRLDVLVNNAGVFESAQLDGITDAQIETQFGINLRGTVYASQHAVRAFDDREQGGAGGRIVNISTVAVENVPTGLGVYAASKAAIEALTESLARELGPRGITVNAVRPGPTETETFRPAGNEEFRTYALSRTPLGRFGRPDDVANVVAFFASDDGAFVTGQSLAVGGGMTF